MTQDVGSAAGQRAVGYSIAQLAELAGISRQRLHVLMQKGKAPKPIRVTWRGAKQGRLIVTQAEANKWLCERYGKGCEPQDLWQAVWPDGLNPRYGGRA